MCAVLSFARRGLCLWRAVLLFCIDVISVYFPTPAVKLGFYNVSCTFHMYM
jgi:hypothetical protein